MKTGRFYLQVQIFFQFSFVIFLKLANKGLNLACHPHSTGQCYQILRKTVLLIANVMSSRQDSKENVCILTPKQNLYWPYLLRRT